MPTVTFGVYMKTPLLIRYLQNESKIKKEVVDFVKQRTVSLYSNNQRIEESDNNNKNNK